jgi:hypothetical protein
MPLSPIGRHLRHCPRSIRRTRFEDGDTAEWGAKVIDDSQFGPGGFGIDGLPIDALPIETDALRDLMPSDSQDYCDVSM